MLLVFLNHFCAVQFRLHDASLRAVYAVTQIASPTFMLVSGVLLGTFFATRASRFPSIAHNYIGRGLFLLLVGHAVIMAFHVPIAGGWSGAVHWGFITDTIAACLIAGPFLVSRVRPGLRAGLALALYVLSWVLVVAWTPTTRIGVILQELLAGPCGPPVVRWHDDVFPLLPWMAVFLAGTCLGEHLARLPDSRRACRSRLAFSWAAVGLATATALHLGGRWLSTHASGFGSLWDRGFFSSFSKLPPSPVYVALYGAIGCAVLGLFLAVEDAPAFGRVRRHLEVMGRNSLILFIAQYGIYFTVLVLIPLPNTPWWPLPFALSAAALLLLAHLWDRSGWNRALILHIPTRLSARIDRFLGARKA